MRKRTAFYCLIFLITSAFANSQSNVIPTIVVKSPQENFFPHRSYGPSQFISQKQITESGATNIGQVLQNMGGVQLHDTTGNGSQTLVSLRGFGANASSNTLFLINGIPITNPDIAPPDLMGIPLYAIETIEIISGSESVLYGDQAVGGVINVLMNERLQRDDMLLICSTGSYQQKNCRIAGTKKWESLIFNTNFFVHHTDNYRDHNNYDLQQLAGFLSFQNAVRRFNIDYQIGNETMQYPGALTQLEVQENRRQASNHRDFFADWNGLLHAKYQEHVAENWQFETDLARRDMHGHGVLFSPFQQMRTINFLKSQLNGNLQQMQLISGFDLEHDDYRLKSAFGLTDNNLNKYSLFSLLNIPLTEKITATIGARGAMQKSALQTDVFLSSINRALAETIGLTYSYLPSTQFYLRRAGSFRFPKADELASTNTGVGELKTQRGYAYETGVKWHRQTASVQLNLYALFLRDEIAFDPLQTPEQPFGSNQNLPPTKRTGFSISGNKQLSPQFAIDGQYNFVNARFQNGVFAGKRIPLVAENILRTGLHYTFHENWQLYLEGIFTGSQFPANDNGNVSHESGGYIVYNFNLSYHQKAFTATFHVNNIFNKLYYLYTVYQTNSQTDFFYPAPERNFTLTFTYDFL